MNQENMQNYVSNYNNDTGMTTYTIPNGSLGNDTGYTLEVIAPSTITSSTQLVTYIDGEEDKSWSNASNALMNNGSNSIVVRGVNGNGYGQDAIDINAQTNIDIVSTVHDIFGGDKNNVVAYGASNGSVYAFETIAKSLEEDHGIHFSKCVNVDYYNSGSYMSDEHIKLLCDNDIKMIIVSDSSDPLRNGCRYPGYEMTSNGNNGTAIIIEYPSGYSHDSKCYFPVEDGLLDWLDGTGELDTKSKNASIYQFINGEQGTEAKSLDEVLEILGISSGYYGDGYQVKLTRDDIKSLSNNVSGTVASDVATVIDNINNITREMNKSEAAISPYRQVTESSASIPSKLCEAQDVMLNISYDLLSSLDREMSLIQNVAQTFYDMDKGLANEAGKLSTGKELFSNSAESIDATLNKLISQEISAKTTFNGQYLFDIGSVTEGKVGSVSMADINNMLGTGSLKGALHDNFDSERMSAKSTMESINNFRDAIGSSTNLQGSAWNLVSEKLGRYSDMMQLRIDSANKLEDAMTKALTLIKDYMGDYQVLDDSRLPELRQTLIDIKAALQEAKQICNATIEVTDYDEKGRVIGSHTEYAYSAAARAEASAYIAWAENQIVEISEEISKLEGLPEIMRRAQNIVNEAMVEVYASYGVEVSGIVTGNESSYIPPNYTPYVEQPIKEFIIESEKDPRTNIFKNETIYNNSSRLQEKYGTYENYLNGVEAKYDHALNANYKDNGKKLTFDFKMDYDILQPAKLAGKTIEKETVKEINWDIKAINPLSIDNAIGAPYYDQHDYGGQMAKSGCGYTAAAMVLAGLTKDSSITPVTFYERTTGKTFGSSTLEAAQYDSLYLSEGPYHDVAKQFYDEIGVTPQHVDLQVENLSDTIRGITSQGKGLVVGNGTHDMVIVPANEEGKIVFYDPTAPEHNGVFEVEELFTKAVDWTGTPRVSGLKWGAAYSLTDGSNAQPQEQAQVDVLKTGDIYREEAKSLFGPETMHKTTSNTNTPQQTTTQPSSGNSPSKYPSYGGSYDAPNTPTITAPKPEIEKPVKPEVEQPVKPEIEQPTKPEVEQPTKPEVEQPVKPEIEQPTKPEVEQPTKPEVEKPTKPEVEEPTKPEVEEPDKPNDTTTVVRPGDHTKPGGTTTVIRPGDHTKPGDDIIHRPIDSTIDSILNPEDIYVDEEIPNITEEQPDIDIIEPPIPPIKENEEIIKDLPVDKVEEKADNDATKAIAVLTGVGAVVGSAAYGAHKYIKSREEEENKSYDEDEDY